MPLLARNSFLGYAVETTWGTAVSPRTHFFRVISLDLRSQDRKVGTPVLAQSSGSFMRRTHFVERNESGGSFRVQFGYEGCGPLLTQIMGADPTTGSPSGGIYPHTWLLGTDFRSATLHAGRGFGVGGSTAQGETFEGCSFTRATLGIETGGIMYYEADVIAETSGGVTTLDTPTFPVELPLLHHQGGTFTFNSATYKVMSARLTIDRKLARQYVLGSKYTQQPFPSDFASVMLELDVDISNEALNTAQLADTQGDITTTFTGTGSRSLAITGHNAYLDDVSNAVESMGRRKQTVRFMMEADDGGDYGLALLLSNTASQANAA